MPEKRVVVLDGAGTGDRDLSPILKVLSDALQADGGQVETFPLREMKLAHCLGCFDCWVKTPGMCVEADAGREIAKAIVRSDVTVLFTPVTFGGYSPELKKIVDRFVQLASPFFADGSRGDSPSAALRASPTARDGGSPAASATRMRRISSRRWPDATRSIFIPPAMRRRWFRHGRRRSAAGALRSAADTGPTRCHSAMRPRR